MATAAPPASTALSATLPVPMASQADEEEDDATSREVLYGYADLMIVGCRYYSGVAHLGEFVDLVREPNNPYDRNAIRVDNLSHQQVGHIKATQACVLSPLLDDHSPGAPRVEASVSVGGTRVYNLPIRANIFGPPERAAGTISSLARLFLKGGMTGKSSGSGHGMAGSGYQGHAVTVHTAVSNPVKTQRELDEMFDKLDADSPHMPTEQTTANTEPVLEATLMAHQKEGLAWMVQRENRPDPNGLPPFWEQRVENGKAVFHNTITCSSQPRKPASVHGGILGDDMGLGKTVQVIALILAQPPRGTDYIKKVRAVEENKRLKELMDRGEVPCSEEKEPTPQEKQELAAKKYKKLKKADLETELAAKGLDTRGKKSDLVDRLSENEAGLTPVDTDAKLGTLVVCPMSVLHNWEVQLAEHVKEGALDVYSYHGGSRNHDPKFLATKDVVITTYDTLASDFAASGGQKAFDDAALAAAAANNGGGVKRKRRHGVMALGWNRVVLDEAHIIRNNKTHKHQACLALSSRYRWCMTGTPLVNKPEDVGALFSFLRLAPASSPRVFTQAIGRPIRSGSDAGLARLRVLMKSVCLRRVKSILGDKLPPKVVEIHRVEMDDDHREAYNTLFNSARAAFRAALAEGESEVMSQYASVLECLLRLRQVCCASTLVPSGRLEQARKVLNQLAKEGPKLGKEEAMKLFAKLKGLLEQDEGAECAVCLELVDAADARVLRGCGHGFCSKCLNSMVKAGPPGMGGGGSASGGRNKCPLCRIEFSQTDVVGGADLEKAGGNAKEVPVEGQQMQQVGAEVGGGAIGLGSAAAVVAGTGGGGKVPPPKVAALLRSLNELRSTGNGDKAVIFSQFTSFLDIMQPFLVADGFKLARLHGSMSSKQRKAELKRFATKGDEGADVMLASLMAAGTGINLTSANHCFIADPWWNASVESQAMDRVHRIGQTKPVRVVRMVSADSIEDRILEMQEAKEALGSGALRKLKPDEIRKARMTDLRTIFECKSDKELVPLS